MSDQDEAISLSEISIDPSCAMKVPASFAFERNILPLCMVNGDFIVAMSDPSDVTAIAALRRALGVPVIAKRAEETELKAYIRKLYGEVQAVRQDSVCEDAVATVDYLIRSAFLRHASDVHFDPGRDGVRVRFRIDGELEEVVWIPEDMQSSVVSRLKVLGGLKLDERRSPQDGGFSFRLQDTFGNGETTLDIRIATLPGRYGERVTLRLLETESKCFQTDSLGFSKEHREIFEGVMNFPHGLVLLTGPTGSGKTTTLYAAIHYLLQSQPLNIITVENPIEYEIPGVFQAEVDCADKVNFSKALRSILRHDPDVIMIGEIRDGESLDTAVKAALTGHLVLSTLHTNDAVNAVTRLTNMGIERHLVAATLRLSVAQRLARVLCPYCRRPHAITAAEAMLCGNPEFEGKIAYRPNGCFRCAGSGIRGRTGLFEFFKPDVAISSAISEGANEADLFAMCRERNAKTLFEDGMEKCLAGIVSLQEVHRVAGVF
ncbi:MAG: type II/IV secretion system protein [Kiritimatiellae bacterium]|nr:type II/IV secretion system protein [Kiritimatiellia bacterium]